MGSGWSFALGLVTGEVVIFTTLTGALGRAVGGLASLGGRVAGKLSRRSWEIGGTRWYPRRQTRSVMEEIVQAMAHSPSDVVPPMLMQALTGGGFDEDEFKARMLQDHAAKIESGYVTCALLLEDERGERPSVELLSDELTFDEVTRIIGKIL